VLDAYSSDTVPMHLITREALALYRQKLAPHGVLAFHISNAYLDLKPVLGNLAQDAHLICLAQDDLDLSPAEQVDGKVGSQWAVMVGDSANLGSLVADVRWKPLGGQPGAAPWTDDYSSILSVMHWH
jgi:hypothetical protein